MIHNRIRRNKSTSNTEHEETKEIASMLKLDSVINNARAHWIGQQQRKKKKKNTHYWQLKRFKFKTMQTTNRLYQF